MNIDQLLEFIKKYDESETLEYKENLKESAAIGKYISALGNSALLAGFPAAHLVWGIKDMTKEIVGTDFEPYKTKSSGKDKMPLITHLSTYTDPHVELNFDEFSTSADKRLVLLTIDVTHINRPIKYHGDEYIRVGTSNKNLAAFPEKERRLWQSFESSKFELESAKVDLSFEEISNLLDVDYYLKARQLETLASTDEIVQHLLDDNILQKTGHTFNITNLGAYTLARNLSSFPKLERRTIRITKYRGDRTLDNATFDKKGQFGIAVSFNNVIKSIMALLPYTESYDEGTREDIPMFPQIAIRELIANALVHQDFSVIGSRPFVEIFDSRIEISNPGIPLIDPKRFLDYKPKSRNDELADLLGKLNIVESRGTGIDKVVNSLESLDLPAMDITIQGNDSTIVTLHESQKFSDMSIAEKNHSIYWHACLKYVENKKISNATLRERFHLTTRNSAAVSKALSNAIDAALIKPYDSEAGRKNMRYIPYWGTDILNS
ncbi:ATP-binding protein [Levilactobacillus brevis]|uniref:ATP-binding protein n=1 Tax=Levilactobacillus brevis TaxID=1580 RepID=UPI003F4B0C0E